MLKTLILAAAIALPLATPAAATGATESVVVAIDDLDLARSQDQQRLDRRIDAAARSLCASGARGIAALQAERRCVALARASAAPQAEQAIALATSGRRLAGRAIAVANPA